MSGLTFTLLIPNCWCMNDNEATHSRLEREWGTRQQTTLAAKLSLAARGRMQYAPTHNSLYYL